ncbi:MAG: nucleotidyltransferase domain-containing protein [Nanoarchaeota archaeon]|nr:nucleotidyltransferase domain-containing protein [Nanoarchaeota archaeon]
MKRNEIISYALAFTSFLLRRIQNVNAVVLFGSVARGDYDNESDIDLFIETEESEKKIEETLKLFKKSKEHEKYLDLGTENQISLKIGKLKDWPSLRESILDNGITLYGKYENLPENLKHFILFAISMKKLHQKTKLKVWRRLYGYKQKVGSKIYMKKGAVEALGGRRLGDGMLAIPKNRENDMIGFLNKLNVNYTKQDVYFNEAG